MPGRRWLRSEMFLLGQLRRHGAKQIAQRLNNRSAGAVQDQAERMGIRLAESRQVMRGIEIRFQVPDKTHESLRLKAAKHGMGLSPYLRRLLTTADAQNLDDHRLGRPARSSARLTMRQISDFADRIDSTGLIGDLRREAAQLDLDLVSYLVEEVIEKRRVVTRRERNSVVQNGKELRQLEA